MVHDDKSLLFFYACTKEKGKIKPPYFAFLFS